MTENERQNIVAKLDALSNDDPEMNHDRADGLLVKALESLGELRIVDAYQRARTRVGFWYA